MRTHLKLRRGAGLLLAVALLCLLGAAADARAQEDGSLREKLREKLVQRWSKRLDAMVPSDLKRFPSEHPVCGNDVCEESETIENCRRDCGVTPPPFHPERFTKLSTGGHERTYLVYTPSCYKKGTPIPVVLNFHGGGGTAEAAEIGIGGMNRKAEEACFLAVYPNGVSIIDIPGKRQHWNGGTRPEDRNQEVDDVAFVDTLLNKLATDYTIDQTRIYATGISNGAMMAYRLACELSERIAAIAPVGGGTVLESCNPKQPVSILHFHGTADPGWPYLGGPGCFTKDIFLSVADVVKAWREREHCANEPRRTLTRGKSHCDTYSCASGTEVALCTIQDGGHTWPGRQAYAFPTEQILKWDADCALGLGRGVGAISADISALDEMWEFFKRHSRQLAQAGKSASP